MIEASGLTKHYGDTTAVDDLSFSVRPGHVTGFLGPNGAGKSTTMRLILGLDRPNAGDVRIDGRRYRELRQPLRTVGALLDASWVHPNRSARTHLLWLARSNKISDTRIDEVLGMVGLSGVADRRAGAYSLGMSQRLGIAAALLGDPKVLLFDEPVNGLDPEGISWVRGLMRSLAAEGRTVFVSSHLLSEMALTADELVVIGRGKLITQCATAEFVANATETAVRVRTPQADQLRALLTERGRSVRETDGALLVGAEAEEIGELAAQHGVVLHELAPQRGSLEQAYIQMTGQELEFHSSSSGQGQPPAGHQHSDGQAASMAHSVEGDQR